MDGLIFVAALSSYNTVLYEDGITNGMLEAVKVFEDIMSNKYFDETSIILILNKKDIFRNMIRDECVPLSHCFSHAGGWPNEREYFTFDLHHNVELPFKTDSEFEEYYSTAVSFITQVFQNRNQRESRKIYAHVTSMLFSLCLFFCFFLFLFL